MNITMGGVTAMVVSFVIGKVLEEYLDKMDPDNKTE